MVVKGSNEPGLLVIDISVQPMAQIVEWAHPLIKHAVFLAYIASWLYICFLHPMSSGVRSYLTPDLFASDMIQKGIG
jgi:hypothetical protein